MLLKTFFYLAATLLLTSACQTQPSPPQDFISGLEKIRTQWAPDPRSSLFEVDYAYEDGHWIIHAESSVPQTQTALTLLVNDNFKADETDFSFSALPPQAFEDTTRAIIRVSVANLRRRPKHSAELVDQVLLGMEVKLLKAQGSWYLVQTAYDYLGWVSGGSMQRMDSSAFTNWQQAEKTVVSRNFTEVFSEASDKSQPVCDAVLGNVFIKGAEKKSWTQVYLPDGRTGFIASADLGALPAVADSSSIGRQEIIARARTMMGIPYLWGGHSTKGLDCSGFTGTVFGTQGLQLPRDANMQAELGEAVTADADYSNIRPGDLFFFGAQEDHISHVAIALGAARFIHASGDVHIGSLDPADDLYDAYRAKTLRRIKRIIKD
jgi:gamma-D-glutamyl-L-lysine dipeptidyl-peptidase